MKRQTFFEYFAWIGWSVLCLSRPMLVESQSWTKATVPNPFTNPAQCGQTRSSYFCDPGLLVDSNLDIAISGTISDIRELSDCLCPCEGGFKPGAWLLQQLTNDDGSLPSSKEEALQLASQFAAYIRENMDQFGTCSDGVTTVVTFHNDEPVIYTSFGQYAGVKLTQDCLQMINEEAKSDFFKANMIGEGIQYIVQQQRSVLLDRRSCEGARQVVPEVPGVIPDPVSSTGFTWTWYIILIIVLLVLLLIAAVAVAIILYRRNKQRGMPPGGAIYTSSVFVADLNSNMQYPVNGQAVVYNNPANGQAVVYNNPAGPANNTPVIPPHYNYQENNPGQQKMNNNYQKVETRPGQQRMNNNYQKVEMRPGQQRMNKNYQRVDMAGRPVPKRKTRAEDIGFKYYTEDPAEAGLNHITGMGKQGFDEIYSDDQGRMDLPYDIL